MKLLLALVISTFCALAVKAQSVEELYKKGDFEALSKYEKKINDLSADELYMVGYAFFWLEDDEKAVKFYDKAISKGNNSAAVHFYKGLSLRYLKKYPDALNEIESALKTEPENQEYMNEKGLIFYDQKDYAKALDIFEQAKKLPPTFPEPFFWSAYIHHINNDYQQALDGYYEALKKLPKENQYYASSLENIGLLEYAITKDFKKSAQAYSELVTLEPENYELQYLLIKSLNNAKEYKKADSVFERVKTAYKQHKLPKEDMELGTIAIGSFEWNGQTAVIRRSFEDPKEILDISYKVFLLSKNKDEVVRRFVVEKTFQFGKSKIKNLLCEEVKPSGHITYSYGWTTDYIQPDDLENAVRLVLDGKMKPAASSNFGK